MGGVGSNPLPPGANDHDILLAVWFQVNRLYLDLQQVTSGQAGMDARVRSLEQFKWWILGASAALSTVSSVASHFLFGK